MVDINIHPRKEEVQFLHPRIVEQLITSAAKQSLERNLSAQFKKEVTFAPAHNWSSERSYNPLPPFIDSFASMQPQNQSAYIYNQPAFEPTAEQMHTVSATIAAAFKDENEQNSLLNESDQEQIATVHKEKNYELIGQYNKTYLLLEKEEGLYLVDQHAAHERILYEQFSSRFEQVATITLMFPQIVQLTKHDLLTIEPHLALICSRGIQVAVFGQDQLIIHSTPVYLKNVNLQELLLEMIGWINEYHHLDTDAFLKSINERLHAQMACKAAVKAGDILTHEQMHQLLDDLEKTDNRFTCPHGRPTGWLLSLYDIEKKFKRKN